jgi:DNA-binding response OmpR family regulator
MPNESSAVYTEATPQPRVSILLVEDEETLRIAVAKMLGKRGFCVMEAADGFAALQILRDHPAQLEAMLLDVSLPGVSSSVVLREAKRLQPGLRVVRLDDVMKLMRRQ